MEPVNIYEVHMQTFKTGKDGEQLSYRTFAKEIAAYAKSMKYNYIELMPIMEYAEDDSMSSSPFTTCISFSRSAE